jgi:hypothetical protein
LALPRPLIGLAFPGIVLAASVDGDTGLRAEPHTFWITETSLGVRLDAERLDDPLSIGLEFGRAWARGEASSLGGSVLLRGDEDLSIGLRIRYRWWLGERVALDVAPGIERLINLNHGTIADSSSIPSLEVGASVNDIGLVVGVASDLFHADVDSTGNTDRDLIWTIRGRVGGTAGFIGMPVLVGLTFLIALLD